MLLIAAAVLVALLLPMDAYALGISPARTELDFEPGMSGTITFSVLNTGHRELTVEMYVSGSLAEYIICDTEFLSFTPADSAKEFSCSYAFPESIEKPGHHDTRIGALEVAGEEGPETMAARVGIESQFWVNVPYPGYYAVVGITAPDVVIGEPVEFTINIQNLGTNPFTATGEIQIFSGDEKVSTVQAGQVYIKPNEEKDLTAEWPTADAAADQYMAVAVVTYSGNEAKAEKAFNVGMLEIEILDLPKVTTRQGDIAKFQPSIKSFWNSPIPDVYIDIEILKSGDAVANGRSETFSLAGWEKKEVLMYVDTGNLPPGVYDVRATLHYLNVTSVRDIQGGLEIITFTIDPQTALIIIITVLVIIAVFVYMKRRKVRRR